MTQQQISILQESITTGQSDVERIMNESIGILMELKSIENITKESELLNKLEGNVKKCIELKDQLTTAMDLYSKSVNPILGQISKQIGSVFNASVDEFTSKYNEFISKYKADLAIRIMRGEK